MNTGEQKMSSWIKRIEDLVNMLEGSTIAELELTEAGTEVIIRRQPGMVMGSTPTQLHSIGQPGVQLAPGSTAAPAVKEDSSVAIIAPLTGVYYTSPSPASPPFVSVHDMLQLGQAIALVEAMKVFNAIQPV